MYYNLEHFVNFWRQTAEIWGVKLWIKWQHIQLIHLIFLLDVFSFGFFFDDLRGQIGLTLGPGTFEPQSPVCLTSVSTQYHAEATYTSSDLAQLEEVCCGTVRLLMREHKHRYTMWTWSIRANRAQARLLPKQCECRTAGEEGPTTGQVDPVTGVWTDTLWQWITSDVPVLFFIQSVESETTKSPSNTLIYKKLFLSFC